MTALWIAIICILTVTTLVVFACAMSSRLSRRENVPETYEDEPVRGEWGELL